MDKIKTYQDYVNYLENLARNTLHCLSKENELPLGSQEIEFELYNYASRIDNPESLMKIMDNLFYTIRNNANYDDKGYDSPLDIYSGDKQHALMREMSILHGVIDNLHKKED